ncbi:uncharacterized protein FOMMEDRAFT_135492 [Fomitiporia mediterranea MF3/22]|uniref:uncharacterized protein n=1 Tax=Fomitiporia mediterranea (strain MF3/22) TaxID=694068 RepID=UPI0004409BE5|nr:uncharacterized protein FOMMEDRAFT_135492 [Fomitiporia mediterranea MF3/22]EJD01256.1 hypothetical protein FOMMEDRAFT_135492 [Fomitiporia mediterranea MF3/22]
MADFYNLALDWPHSDAHSVIVTGTFDNWTSSVHLNKSDTGFTTSVAVPWDSKILYKFIVDGNWLNHPNQPIETDSNGNVNNVLHTPTKPAVPPPTEGAGVVAPSKEAIDDKQPGEKAEVPVEVASDVPVAIQPIVDDSAAKSVESKPVDSEAGPSTHTPAVETVTEAPSASEPATTAPVPAPTTSAEPTPSTPPQTRSELPVTTSPVAPVTPIKTNGHTRTSTSTTTAPSSSAPSTPKTQSTFPSMSPGEKDASPDSRFGSIGREKRLSIFGRLKKRLTPGKEKKDKARLGSASPRSASPTPSPSPRK